MGTPSSKANHSGLPAHRISAPSSAKHEIALRIKQLGVRQEEVSKARVILEAKMAISSVKLLSPAEVKAYTRDLVALLTETDVVKSKGFLRSFIDRIIIDGNKCTIISS